MAKRRRYLGYAAYWRKDRGCWYWRSQVQGERRRGKLDGLTDRRRDEAAAWARAAQIHVDLQREARGPDPGTLTLRELLEHDVQRPGIREATRRLAIEKGRRLIEGLGKDRQVETITTGALDAYAGQRAESVSPRSVNMELALLRAAWQRAHEDGMLCPPPKIRRLPGVRHSPTILSRDQLERLLRAARERDARVRRRRGTPRLEHVIAVLANTGLRRGELFRMKWGDIDFDARTVRVLTAKRGSAGEYRTRTVPLNNAAVIALQERRQECGDPAAEAAVFGDRGEPGEIAKAGLFYKPLREAAKAAGLQQPVRLHDLRHSFAMMAFGAGLDVVTVSRLLGHTSPQTTMNIYLHDRPEEARAALEAFSTDISDAKSSDESQ